MLGVGSGRPSRLGARSIRTVQDLPGVVPMPAPPPGPDGSCSPPGANSLGPLRALPRGLQRPPESGPHPLWGLRKDRKQSPVPVTAALRASSSAETAGSRRSPASRGLSLSLWLCARSRNWSLTERGSAGGALATLWGAPPPGVSSPPSSCRSRGRGGDGVRLLCCNDLRECRSPVA